MLLGIACGCMPKMPAPYEPSPDRFNFHAVLHSPGTLAGMPADHWYAEPLPEDKKLGRKPLAIDVSAVTDRARELDGRRVKLFRRMPKTKEEAEAEIARNVVSIHAIEPAE
jgi:hypothetical protein